MLWLLLIPLAALITAAVMLYLSLCDLLNDWRKWRWMVLRRSPDMIALAVGFVCMILTSLYPLIASAIWFSR